MAKKVSLSILPPKRLLFQEYMRKKRWKRVEGLLEKLLDKSPPKYLHAIQVGRLAREIYYWLCELKHPETLKLQKIGITPEDVKVAGQLHDIGQLKWPRKLLSGTVQPTKKEIEKYIKKHPQKSARILRLHVFGISEVFSKRSREISKAVKFHHEHADASGYPLKLKTEKIPLLAKIITIADIYTAMTEDRPSRLTPQYYTVSNQHSARKHSPAEAVAEIVKDIKFAGEEIGVFDADVAKAFLLALKNMDVKYGRPPLKEEIISQIKKLPLLLEEAKQNGKIYGADYEIEMARLSPRRIERLIKFVEENYKTIKRD